MKLFVKNNIVLAGIAGAVLSVGLTTTNIAYANAVDEAADACKEAARLITEEDDLDAALEEANWCVTGLKQLKDEIKLSLLPDEILGYVGGDIENENIMGMSTVKRVYAQDGDKLTVSLITSGDLGGALGGLGELGKLFGALEGAGGAAAGGKKIRIQRRTVLVSDEGGSGALTVQLKSGGTIQVESRDLDSDELVEFMREFPIAEIDDATAE